MTARADKNSTVKVHVEFASSTVNWLPIDCLFTYLVRQLSCSILKVSIKSFHICALTGTANRIIVLFSKHSNFSLHCWPVISYIQFFVSKRNYFLI